MPGGVKAALRDIVPMSLWMKISTVKRNMIRSALRQSVLKHGWISSYFNAWELNSYGLNVSLNSDYYSPLPDLQRLQKNRGRWTKPSSLVGLKIDLQEMENLWSHVAATFREEFDGLPSYAELMKESYGEGYTPLDAMTLYFLLRQKHPRRYLEVGAGLSTYYASCSARQNLAEGQPMEITSVEPYPHEKLKSIAGINLIEKDVQEVDLSLFEALGVGDVLFIDSTHALKLDGDVAYLFLEILPRLSPGVIIHIHDIPFPYNCPFPPDTWVLNREWPVFWTEAMLLQAFLCYNSDFQIRLSLPYIRYRDEEFLRKSISGYDQWKGVGAVHVFLDLDGKDLSDCFGGRLAPAELSMITFFSTPKPFRGHIAIIQRNAIKSWKLVHPHAEVILFGDEEGAAEAARDLGARHEPEVERNSHGTPLLSSLFGRADLLARHDRLCFLNSDILLTDDFFAVL